MTPGSSRADCVASLALVTKKLAKEINIWSKLDHPNVLPLLGYYTEGGVYPHLISEWMENGPLSRYVKVLPKGIKTVRMVSHIANHTVPRIQHLLFLFL